MQDMDGVDQLGLSFAYLKLDFCADVAGVRPDDEVTDGNKVRLHGGRTPGKCCLLLSPWTAEPPARPRWGDERQEHVNGLPTQHINNFHRGNKCLGVI